MSLSITLLYVLFLTTNFYYTRDVAFKGDYAFTASGENGIRVILVVDPLRRHVVSTYPASNYVSRLLVHGDYLFVADSGLKILDISDPLNLTEISHLRSPLSITDIFYIDNKLLIADRWSGLTILDISDPSNPQRIGTYSDSGYYTLGVLAKNNYVYLLEMDNSLWYSSRIVSLDITTPSNPQYLWEKSVGSSSSSIFYENNEIYITNPWGFWILNVEDPYSPTITGRYSLQHCNSIYVENDIAYVTHDDGVKILDVSDPTNIRLISNFDMFGHHPEKVYKKGDYIYVADGDDGLFIIDVNNIQQPRSIGSILQNYVHRIVKQGNYAYLASRLGGVDIVDISNKYFPYTVIHFNDSMAVSDLCLNHDKLFLAGRYGVDIMDINNPYQPRKIIRFLGYSNQGYYNWVHRITVQDTIMYISSYSRMGIFSINNINAPYLLGEYRTADDIDEFTVYGNYIYLSGGDVSPFLSILDVTDPSNPTVISSITLPEHARGIERRGHKLYVACGNHGLKMFDVSDPSNPTELSTYSTPGCACELDVRNHYVYIADGDYGIRIIDVDDPTNPNEVYYYDVPTFVSDVSVDENYVYAVSFDKGLYIYKSITENLPQIDLVALGVDFQNIADSIKITGRFFYQGEDILQNLEVNIGVRDRITDSFFVIKDTIISTIYPNQNVSVTAKWLPEFTSCDFLLFLDPNNEICEFDEENNILSRYLNISRPHIDSLKALYDGIPNNKIFGRYISGIQLLNSFTAYASTSDSEKYISKVLFIIDQDTLVDSTPSDGWLFEYDVGNLSGPNQIKVIAIDDIGICSDTDIYFIETIPMPHWLELYTQTFGCEFYFDYNDNVYKTGDDYFPLDVQGSYVIPNDVFLLGNLETRLTGGVRLETSIPLERCENIIHVEPDCGLGLKILGYRVFQRDLTDLTGLQLVRSSTYINPTNLNISEIELHMSEPFIFPKFKLFEKKWNKLIIVHGIPLRISADIGGEVVPRLQDAGVSLNPDLNFNQLFVEPGAQIIVDLSSKVDVIFGVASVGLLAHPTADMIADLLYPPMDFSLSGAFSVPYELIGSLGWGYISGTLYEGTLGPWTFGTKGEEILQYRLPILLARLDSLNVPDIMPNPYMATDSYGHAMVVWIHDNDPAPRQVNPDVYYSVYDGTSWSSPLPIEQGTNNRFELDPKVAFLPNGDALAVWSANTASNNVKDIGQIFKTQDIYYSVWNHEDGTWTESERLISDSLPDGLASVAAGPDGQVLVAWTKILSDSISDKSSWSIYYTFWNGNQWSAPTPIPGTENNNAADCKVKVAYSPNGTAIAIWVYDADGDFTTPFDTDLKYAIWNGQSWGPIYDLTSTTEEAEQTVSVVFDFIGRGFAVWVGKDSTIDRIYFSMMDTTGHWINPELIVESQEFASQPIIQVTDSGTVIVFWRGYQGYDGDLFYTMKNLDDSIGRWIQPRTLTNDSLTDWLATMAVDVNNNLLYMWSKWNWTGLQPITTSDGRYFTDGLFFGSKGVKSDMSFGDLNTGSHSILPDLAVSNSDIFTPDTFANLGDTILISAIVRNIGDVASDTVTVRFTFGHPDSGGVTIRSDFRISLKPDSAETLNIQWIMQSGINKIYVIIDPDDSLEELNESNNTAFIYCYVYPDFSIDSTDVSFNRYNPLLNDSLILSAYIHNIGSIPSETTFVAVYKCSVPDTDSLLFIDTIKIPIIPPDSTHLVEFHILATQGVNKYCVMIDPLNQISESNEFNNEASIFLNVLPDLEIDSIEIDTLNHDTTSILLSLFNNGGVRADSFYIKVYDGIPCLNNIIDSIFIEQLSAFNRIDSLKVYWSPSIGNHQLYAVADPQNNINERDEFNNQVYYQIYIKGYPDLIINSERVNLTSDHPHSGDSVEVSTWIKNVGNTRAFGIPIKTYIIINNDTNFVSNSEIPSINVGDSAFVEFQVVIPTYSEGEIRLLVIIDPENTISELDKNNNSALLPLYVNMPQIQVTPDSIKNVLDIGEVWEDTMYIFNKGSGTLQFNINVEYTSKLPKSSHLSSRIEDLKFKNPIEWLSIHPDTGTIEEGDSLMILIASNENFIGYFYHIAHVNIISNDSGNPIMNIPVILGIKPPPPTIIYPADSDTVTNSLPTFIWSAIDSFSIIYLVQVATDSGFSEVIMEATNIIDTTYVAGHRFVNGTYWWRIKAITLDNISGDFSRRNEFTVNIDTLILDTLLVGVEDIPYTIQAQIPVFIHHVHTFDSLCTMFRYDTTVLHFDSLQINSIYDFTCNTLNCGDSVFIQFYSSEGNTISEGYDTLFYLFFEVDTNMINPGDSTYLGVAYTVLSSPNSFNIFDVINIGGWVRIIGEKGDLNLDNEVNIVDVVREVNIILSRPPEPSNYEMWAGDLNNDGDINVVDVVATVNIILGRGEKEVGGKARLIVDKGEVYLRSEVDVGGVQFDIVGDVSDVEVLKGDFPVYVERKEWGVRVLFVDIRGGRMSKGEYPLVKFTGSGGIERVMISDIYGNDVTEREGRLRLYPISPNVVHDMLRLRYSIARRGRVSISIYDVSGRRVEVLMDKQVSVGEYEESVDVGGLSSGVYIVELKTDKKRFLQKFIKL